MCLSKYVKVWFIGTIITTVSDVLSLVTRNYPTVCIDFWQYKVEVEVYSIITVYSSIIII